MNKGYIPDISYHLIFHFLTLKELTSTYQCCKEWKRIITEKSFKKIFLQSNYVHEVNSETSFQLLSTSHFRHLIQNIKLSKMPLNLTSLLIEFQSIISLDLEIDLSDLTQEERIFDITPIFKALSFRLIKFTVEICILNPYRFPPSFYYFQSSLSLLSSLVSLTLMKTCREKIFDKPSFLSQMKQLQSFQFNDIFGCDDKDIIQSLLSLPELTHLEINYYSHNSQFALLRELSANSENIQLKHLGKFNYLNQVEQSHYLQILNNFNYLKTIEISVNCQNALPILLGNWIHHLKILSRKFTDQDIIDIVNLPFLDSLELLNCTIQNLQLKQMINGLSPRLKALHIRTDENFNCVISFKTLSHCKELKSITLTHVCVVGNKFDILLHCKKLQTINIKQLDFGPKMLNILIDFHLKESPFDLNSSDIDIFLLLGFFSYYLLIFLRYAIYFSSLISSCSIF
jgi:hypothetical protein